MTATVVVAKQYVQGVTAPSVKDRSMAAILKVPVGTVRSRLSRGRDQLRRLMGMPEKLRYGEREHLHAA